jgi:large subunit ribosomal protein L21
VAEVVEHGRDKKVRVFKMKRRKTYRRTKGHRQHFTQLRITAIQA